MFLANAETHLLVRCYSRVMQKISYCIYFTRVLATYYTLLANQKRAIISLILF